MADAAHTLASALQERGISFKKASIESDFNLDTEYGRKNAQWASEHLSPHTLLSKEEVALFRNLEASGASQTFTRHPALASTRPLDEDAIREATASLKASTATYRKQTAALKAQNEILDNLQARGREAGRTHEQGVTALTRRHLLEKQRKTAMADDLVKDFESRMLLEQQQMHILKGQFLQKVTSKLKSDDRALVEAERFAAELELTEEDEKTEKRAMELTSSLSKLVSDEIYCRLDRLYLEALLTGDESTESRPEMRDQISEIEDDLQSLYLEVHVLAEMSSKHEFGQRIRDKLQHNKKSLSHSLEDCLEMADSNSEIVDRLLYHQSRREALNLLSASYTSDGARNEAAQSKSKMSHRRQSSLGFGAAMQPPVLPPKHQLQALENILRRLGLSGTDQTSSLQAGPESLISESRSRMIDLLHNLSTSAEMPLKEYLEPTDKAMELFTAVLQSNSDFRLSLLDPSQKERLAELERELTIVQKGIEGVDLGVLVEQSQGRGKQFRAADYS
ncbi:hypothetical protein PISL3812_07481 [Talaromyces islandicus]|uniref:HAUS augmin-like complex subunit 3 N-terminal domain-containing protein n=1 Tax=Talaromyces islandicus TaxID=28573 RepID=A0A0U1M4H1_TALIS|nr:hypothetical protein PISL3812_07481 [Talaromyces islandicus]